MIPRPLSLEEFGRQLLVTNDLDPLYVLLHNAGMPRDQLRRWCLAYWCCYHAGLSCWLSEQQMFWGHMRAFAFNDTPSPLGDRWPRGTERRHFRGLKAVESIEYLTKRFPEPEQAVICLEESKSFWTLRNRVMEWPQFGPWIAFKVGDMLERVIGTPITFDNADIFVFDSPRDAAQIFHAETAQGTGGDPVKYSLLYLQQELGSFDAPPRYERKLNLQEYETILCKWKSHRNGHYPVGKDTKEILHGLKEWEAVSAVAWNLSDAAKWLSRS